MPFMAQSHLLGLDKGSTTMQLTMWTTKIDMLEIESGNNLCKVLDSFKCQSVSLT